MLISDLVNNKQKSILNQNSIDCQAIQLIIQQKNNVGIKMLLESRLNEAMNIFKEIELELLTIIQHQTSQNSLKKDILNLKKELGILQNNSGVTYMKKGQFNQAVKCFQSSVMIFKGIQDKNLNMAVSSLNYLELCYQQNLIAQEYKYLLQECSDIIKKSNNQQEKNQDSDCLQPTFFIHQQISYDSSSLLGYWKFYKAILYQTQENFQKAIQYFSESEKAIQNNAINKTAQNYKEQCIQKVNLKNNNKSANKHQAIQQEQQKIGISNQLESPRGPQYNQQQQKGKSKFNTKQINYRKSYSRHETPRKLSKSENTSLQRLRKANVQKYRNETYYPTLNSQTISFLNASSLQNTWNISQNNNNNNNSHFMGSSSGSQNKFFNTQYGDSHHTNGTTINTISLYSTAIKSNSNNSYQPQLGLVQVQQQNIISNDNQIKLSRIHSTSNKKHRKRTPIGTVRLKDISSQQITHRDGSYNVNSNYSNNQIVKIKNYSANKQKTQDINLQKQSLNLDQVKNEQQKQNSQKHNLYGSRTISTDRSNKSNYKRYEPNQENQQKNNQEVNTQEDIYKKLFKYMEESKIHTKAIKPPNQNLDSEKDQAQLKNLLQQEQSRPLSVQKQKDNQTQNKRQIGQKGKSLDLTQNNDENFKYSTIENYNINIADINSFRGNYQQKQKNKIIAQHNQIYQLYQGSSKPTENNKGDQNNSTNSLKFNVDKQKILYIMALKKNQKNLINNFQFFKNKQKQKQQENLNIKNTEDDDHADNNNDKQVIQNEKLQEEKINKLKSLIGRLTVDLKKFQNEHSIAHNFLCELEQRQLNQFTISDQEYQQNEQAKRDLLILQQQYYSQKNQQNEKFSTVPIKNTDVSKTTTDCCEEKNILDILNDSNENTSESFIFGEEDDSFLQKEKEDNECQVNSCQGSYISDNITNSDRQQLTNQLQIKQYNNNSIIEEQNFPKLNGDQLIESIKRLIYKVSE